MNQVFRNLSLRHTLTLAILLSSVIPLGIAAALVWTYQVTSLHALAVHDLDVKADVFAAALRAAVEFKDLPRAEEILATQRPRREVVAIGVFEPGGRLFASYHQAGSATLPPLRTGNAGKVEPVGDDLEIFQAIHSGPDLVGFLYLRTDLAVYYARLPFQAAIVLGVLVLLLGVTWYLSRLFQQSIFQPILTLAETMHAVGKRPDYSVRLPPRGQDEIGTLTEGINEMLAGIQLRDIALRAVNDTLNVENAARHQAEQTLRTLNLSLEHQVEARTAALQAANKELEAFSASISHDLRAPLRHIHGYVEMLAAATAGQLAEKPQRYLRTIAQASAEMGVLIDDLLAFSRMSRSELTEEHVSLDTLAQEALGGLELVVQGRNLQWQIAPLPTVMGDRAMLRQVLANLLGNAVKYSRGRDPARIELGVAGEEAGRTIVFVRDNGAGFDMRYAHKLFGVFQRLHRAEEFEGTGIGLATVQRIISRHGGRTWAQATLGEGATFYFTLKPAVAL